MSTWKGKHLVIVGAARQGYALAKYLKGKGVRLTITDQKKQEDLKNMQKELGVENINWVTGGHPLSLLDNADGLALSGGIPLDIPLVQEAIRRQIPLTNDSQVFMDLVPCPVIGITGSAGKTTTTLLVGKIVEHALGESRTWVGGNIGNPLISAVDDMEADHLVVLELSSFQLEIMTRSPNVACILNITPNHLDRHKTMQAYTLAKARLLDFQDKADIAILNRDNQGSWDLKSKVKGDLISFGLSRPTGKVPGTFLEQDQIYFWNGEESQKLLPISDIKLRGEHNLFNVLAASAVALAAELPPESIQEGVKKLEGVDHRLEIVRTWKGAKWINDSIATAPERAVAAIHSFDEPLVLLAGGRDKDLPWDDFSQLVQKRVKQVILFGEAADLIEENLLRAAQGSQSEVPYLKCSGLEDAVQQAGILAQPGDVVLLAPGGTSFDEFEDFADRGEHFRQWVQNLS